MTEATTNFIEGAIYRVWEFGKEDGAGEIAKFEKGRFWFFGWEMPEKPDKFSKWEKLLVSKQV